MAQNKANPDKAFYDNTAEEKQKLTESSLCLWMKKIESYFHLYAILVNKHCENTTGKVVELGAGSCVLSLCLSRLNNVKEVVCFDISKSRMETYMKVSQQCVGGNMNKLTLQEGDFNAPLPFPDKSIDVLVFDASLHHSRSIWHLLRECNRVLRNNGYLIAQREQYLSLLFTKSRIKRLLQSEEVSLGVSENTYLREQYEYYLAVHGFKTTFIKTNNPPIKKWLKFLNGILFTDGVLVSIKEKNLT